MEKIIGTLFALLGILIVPVPFIGIYSALQVIVFIIWGYISNVIGWIQTDGFGNASMGDIAFETFIICIVLSIVFIYAGFWKMYASRKYDEVGPWIRIIGYFITLGINVTYLFSVINQPIK